MYLFSFNWAIKVLFLIRSTQGFSPLSSFHLHTATSSVVGAPISVGAPRSKSAGQAGGGWTDGKLGGMSFWGAFQGHARVGHGHARAWRPAQGGSQQQAGGHAAVQPAGAPGNRQV